MFTGIVQHVGVVRSFAPTESGARLIVDIGDWHHRAKPGDSIAVSGCCLTHAPAAGDVTSDLAFDVVHETLRKTRLGALAVGGRVNLEPALAVGDRIDGHFVLGHVDSIARVTAVENLAGEYLLRFIADPSVAPYLVPTGSVAVDGVSLTLARTDPAHAAFAVALIPTTLQRTTLGLLRPDDTVNLEADVLVKAAVQSVAHLRR